MQGLQRVGAGFVLAGAMVASSCGGGGSSPPPPAPSAVTATASASAASVQEGQPFSVDASASATTNGAPLAYAWTQVSGPTVAIANPNAARLDLTAAEVTADIPAQFRVTVTAGAASAQATTSVTFANIAQTPAYASSQTLATVNFTTPVRKVFGGDLNFALAGYAANTTDPLSFLDFSLSATNTLQVGPSQLGGLPQSAILKTTSLYIGAAIADQQFVAVEENADRMRVFTRSFTTGAITTRGDFALADPCGVSQAHVSPGRSLLVGQRDGFSFFRETTGGGGPVFDRAFSAGRPMCALVAATSQLSGLALNGPAPVYPHVIALDAATNQLVVYAPSTLGADAVYAVSQTAAAQLNASKPLTLAAWAPLQSGIGGPGGMALVFTDGVHNGEHRLVVAGFNASRTLVQTTYSLGLGVPIEVFVDNVDADLNYPEVVVVKSTSPQAEIFEPPTTGFGFSPLGTQKFLEIGLGASSAFPSGIFGLQGITVAFPAKSQVKVVGPAP